MRICVHKPTKKIIEMQSHATEGTLIQNAINAGYQLSEIEEKVVDEAGFQAALANDPVEIAQLALREEAKQNELDKKQAIIDNLPSWLQVQDTINNISNLAEAKAYLLKLSRVVYWLAKDSKL